MHGHRHTATLSLHTPKLRITIETYYLNISCNSRDSLQTLKQEFFLCVLLSEIHVLDHHTGE